MHVVVVLAKQRQRGQVVNRDIKEALDLTLVQVEGCLLYTSMEAAAFLPAPIARMTVAAPVTMSPPAQMRGSVVWPVSSSATM